jgi:tetratricopeptide (TPR) repeat protein
MELDPYGQCPCCSGEKFRFCCPRELHGDMSRVLQLIYDDKWVVAQEMLQRLRQRHPRQACLLVADLVVAYVQGRLDALVTLRKELAASHPNHPAVKYFEAAEFLHQGKLREAIIAYAECFGQFYDKFRSVNPQITNKSLLIFLLPDLVGRCMESGNFVAAMSLTVSEVIDWTGVTDRWKGLRLARQIVASSRVPLPFRDMYGFRVREIFLENNQEMGANYFANIAFTRALRLAEEQARLFPQNQEWLFAIGVIQAILCDNQAAATTLRTYAAHPDAHHWWAISAMLLAEHLAPRPVGIPVRNYEGDLTDIDGLVERLLSERRMVPNDEEMAWDVEEGPPPKHRFIFLDRPYLRTGAGQIPVSAWPKAQGQIVIFGKQTDRPARIEFQVIGEDAEGWLSELVRPFVASPLRMVSELRLNPMIPGWLRPPVPPGDASEDECDAAMTQFLREEIGPAWLNAAHPLLDGKTPLEAKAQGMKRPLTAALLDLLSHPPGSTIAFELEYLWDELGIDRSVDLDELTGDLYVKYVSGERKVSIYQILGQDFRRLSVKTFLLCAWILYQYDAHLFGPVLAAAFDRHEDEIMEQQTHSLLLSMAWKYGRLVLAGDYRDFMRRARQTFNRADDMLLSKAMLNELALEYGVNQQQFEDTLREFEERFGTNQLLMDECRALVNHLKARESMEEKQEAAKVAAEAGSKLWTPGQPTESPERVASVERKLWIPGT